MRLCLYHQKGSPMSSYLTPLLVALGGALGALTRYTVTLVAASFLGSSFPYGTLIVNGAGSPCRCPTAKTPFPAIGREGRFLRKHGFNRSVRLNQYFLISISLLPSSPCTPCRK